MGESFNLLMDPLLTVRLPGGERVGMTLPGVLTQLARDDVAAFLALRRHQRHAWHAFLVQLAAVVLERAGLRIEDAVEVDWTALLLQLTAGRQEPWCLVVPDLAQSAFMQPPVPEGSLDGFKEQATTPDAVDMLVTAKSHDLKQGMAVAAEPQDWCFALLTLQTMEGQMGAGKYGVSRMNGGYGNRPGVAFAPSCGWGARWRRDVSVLLGVSESARETHGFAIREYGHALLWLLPWDGTERLPLGDLHPWYIEICRRIRMVQSSAGLCFLDKGTAGQRIAAKELKGNLADVWTPVVLGDVPKALTVAGDGFTYRRVVDLLFGDNHRLAAAQQQSADDVWFLAQAMTRGQGQTDGYHERAIYLPPRVRPLLRVPTERERWKLRAVGMVESAGWAQKVLKTAVLVYLQEPGEGGKVDFGDKRAECWVTRLDAKIDAVFFDSLWQAPEDAGVDELRGWHDELLRLAEETFRQAIESVPVAEAHRYRALVAAQDAFRHMARKRLPSAGRWSRRDALSEEVTT